MLFGLTRGEILLIVFVFVLVYSAGLLPRIARALSGAPAPGAEKPSADDDAEKDA